MSKRTPLYAQHISLDAKMVEFAGFEMPLEYSGIIDEHHAVRNAAGLFDVSHMSQIECRGRDSALLLQYLTVNDVAALVDGKAHYSLLLNERGGIIDDIIVYRHAADHYLLVVNAGNADTDWHWLLGHQQGDVTLTNRSGTSALLALQGPNAEEILQPGTTSDLKALKSFHSVRTTVQGLPVVIARTGYTGEAGFELSMDGSDSPKCWQWLIDTGSSRGLKPCGLGARDTLRLEMGYRLHGHDMNDKTTPWEAQLGWVVKLGKRDFCGRAALVAQQAEGCKRLLVAFKMVDVGIPRETYPIISQRKPVGYVTSGTHSPSLRKGIGLGYVPPKLAAEGTKFSIDIRGKERLAEVVALPFYEK
ncbi:MAG: glycine cleavage system aminomethyltransferase GcvT [Deltaproteobacteria bacterium]|nr:glycine cleavage system aminomethyltransferase GcvT [Deltaproteobacteria bacterium]